MKNPLLHASGIMDGLKPVDATHELGDLFAVFGPECQATIMLFPKFPAIHHTFTPP